MEKTHAPLLPSINDSYGSHIPALVTLLKLGRGYRLPT